MAWRVAKSLEVLKKQVDAKWPNRDKSSDGSIGDAAHQATSSDHNPNSADVVTAIDITNDPVKGPNARKLAESLVASRDPRIKYIISNAQIVSSVVSPWVWRAYTGSNAHRAHVHVSVSASPGLYDKVGDWNIDLESGPAILGRGSVGEEVKELQRLLGVEVDGEFGVETEAAVRLYQTNNGLDVDGLVGVAVWASLRGKPPPEAERSGKGSWFGQYRGKYEWVDEGDKPNSNALGVPDDAQGISFLDQTTKGKWFEVVAPNGKTSIEQQTDVGPAAWTGRLIDIHAAAAERFGYKPSDFPTDSIWRWRSIAVPAAVAGLTPKEQATKYRDLRDVPELVPDTTQAKILAALNNLNLRVAALEKRPLAIVGERSGWVEAIAGLGSGMERLPEIVGAVDKLLDRAPQLVDTVERIGALVERFAPLIGMFSGGRVGLASGGGLAEVISRPGVQIGSVGAIGTIMSSIFGLITDPQVLHALLAGTGGVAALSATGITGKVKDVVKK